MQVIVNDIGEEAHEEAKLEESADADEMLDSDPNFLMDQCKGSELEDLKARDSPVIKGFR